MPAARLWRESCWRRAGFCGRCQSARSVWRLLWCCTIVGFSATGSSELALALLFAAGFLELSFGAMAQTLIQLRAPTAIRGRVIGVFNMAALGMRTFSGITIGVIGGLIGVHWSLALSGIMLSAAVAALFGYLKRSEVTGPS